MGNNHSEIEEQKLQEWLNLIAQRAGSACDARVATIADSLLEMLGDLQADKDLLSQVATQQSDLLKSKSLDIGPLIHKAELAKLHETIEPLTDYSLFIWSLILLLSIVIVIQAVVICLSEQPIITSGLNRIRAAWGSTKGGSSVVNTPLRAQRSPSMKSILPL
ncbi:MAG: hypothetical protein [Wenzhou bat rhabdovirus 2]|nr:MAG: hypothetical protein [Wenzhou bat rhabdovirus 2]